MAAKGSQQAPAAAQRQQLLAQAVQLHRQGAWGQAQQCYEQLLSQDPQHYDALQLLGVLASQNQDYAASVALITKAIAVEPGHASAHSNLGFAYKALGRFEAAVQSYQKALALQPDFVQAHLQCGLAYLGWEQPQPALAHFDCVIALQPEQAQAHCNRGVALAKLGRLQEAVAAYQAALRAQPDVPEVYFNWGNALHALREYAPALQAFDHAIALRADYADAWTNRGNVCKALSRLEEALACYDRAIAISPDDPNAYVNQGVAYFESLMLDKAVASCDRAIALQPEHAEAQWNKALALLLSGDLAQGFALHEWRWRRSTFSSQRRHFGQTLWLGQTPLAGKTILLHAEQGLGDTIQFCRYCALVQALGARVVLEVQAPLMGLLAQLPGVDVLVQQGHALPPFDLHCPLLSLPLAFQTRLDSIPAARHYLSSAPDKRAAWAQRLGARTRPRIGLAWRGSALHKNDHHRSMALAELLRHLPPGYAYVSLQKEVPDQDVDALQAHQIAHFEDAIEDFTDTAALCDLMDGVVSVDTSVAHLAGALGKPVHLLLPRVPDWRWLLERQDSPWYPTMRLYRRDTQRDWMIDPELFGRDVQKRP